MRKPGNSWRRGLSLAVLGAVLWAVWAYYANRLHGDAAAVPAALTQATVAFLITFFMTASAQFFIRFRTRPMQRLAAALGGTFGIIIPVTSGVHALAGTPEILKTLSPAWAVGIVFCAGYAVTLLRAEDGAGGEARQRAETS